MQHGKKSSARIQALWKCSISRLSYHVRHEVNDLELPVAVNHGQRWCNVQLRIDDGVELVPKVHDVGNVDDLDLVWQLGDVVGQERNHNQLKLVRLARADVQHQAVGDQLKDFNKNRYQDWDTLCSDLSEGNFFLRERQFLEGCLNSVSKFFLIQSNTELLFNPLLCVQSSNP